MMEPEPTLPNGVASAAFLAAGVGSFALGFLTTLAATSVAISQVLAVYGAVGPLSGVTIGAILIWVITWGVLHTRWRHRQVDLGRAFVVTLVLIALGLLGTFPPVYQSGGP